MKNVPLPTPFLKTGRPIEFDRDEALRVAMESFWRDGFERTPVTALAEAMGITRSSFYNSFGERNDIFREVLALYAREAPDAPLADLSPGDTIVPPLTAILHDLCATRAKDRDHKGCLVVNSIAGLVGANGALGPVLTDAVKKRAKHIEQLFEAAQTRGEIRLRTDPRTAALSFLTLICGINILAKVMHKQQDLEEVTSLMFGAIVGTPAS